MSSQRTVEESKDTESDTALHWRITYPEPYWAKLFSLRSFIKTHATSTKGRGVSGRALYAISAAVIARGDDGRWKPNYSHVLGNFSAAAISNLYYPASDRGASLVVFNGLADIGANAVSNLIREFLLKRITSHVPEGADGEPYDGRKNAYEVSVTSRPPSMRSPAA